MRHAVKIQRKLSLSAINGKSGLGSVGHISLYTAEFPCYVFSNQHAKIKGHEKSKGGFFFYSLWNVIFCFDMSIICAITNSFKENHNMFENIRMMGMTEKICHYKTVTKCGDISETASHES